MIMMTPSGHIHDCPLKCNDCVPFCVPSKTKTEGSFSVSTGVMTAHQLYNYITDHASTYSMKPVRMSKAAANTDGKKGAASGADHHEYALVALWNRSIPS